VDLDRYIPRHSSVHRADPRLKVVLTAAAVLGVALLPVGAFWAFAIVWFVLVGASTLAHLGPLRLVRGSWVVLPFVIVALPLLFTREGEAVLTLTLGPLTLTVTDVGVRDVLSIMLKSWLSVQAALLLAYTTPFSSLVDALRALRIPAVIVSIISFMYRYLAVLADEASRMSRARRSRSAAAPEGRSGGSVTWRARVTGAMVGSLFIRSYERSERVYAAMLARGFDGTFRTAELPRLTNRDLGIFAIAVSGIALFTLAANLWALGR
jgi:cobalt/nickel transport system permease protein